ncbi:MAG TPA: DUF3857 domain-containing protein [Candidatus Methylomirabilis sp.]|nr:DUF3857 domain-containing protein [Candidatus Methylomirabilis sp.]
MRLRFRRIAATALGFCLLVPIAALGQEHSQEPAAPPKTEGRGEAPLPAEITLLETKVRFEANGDSRKEVHAIVKINNEIGVTQFARLNFDFNRSFQNVEIPFVRITHASGGTADILPSAITDNPNPAVVDAPAYQDVRVKSVRILGLGPGDGLEYRVITTTTRPPLAPDFWFEHSFDRTGVVSHEIFELDLPASRNPKTRINPAAPPDSVERAKGDDGSIIYKWNRVHQRETKQSDAKEADTEEPDIALSTEQWETLSIRLDERLSFEDQPLKHLGAYEENGDAQAKRQSASSGVAAKALELTKDIDENRAKLIALYDFVSQKIKTVDLPLGSTGFVTRPPDTILTSGYATQEDKFVLFVQLASAVKLSAGAALTGYCDKRGPASPLEFKRLLVYASDGNKRYWLDPSLEVAPFGMIPPNSGSCAFLLNRFFFAMNSTGHEWAKLDAPLPFRAKQRVSIDATISPDGKLSSQVKYTMRGQNELLLRVAFHKTPKEDWKNVAQLLALGDGFRGQISKVKPSDPYDTKSPFTVEYEIAQAKFVDWSKKPVLIPALLPLLGLPDPPQKSKPGSPPKPIELGTPLDVEVTATVQLPVGTTAQIPAGTSVAHDFATYSSQYSANGTTITAARHINFILREIPADRAFDYAAFLRTVQNDESQVFTLERHDADAPKPQSGKR